MTTATVEPQTIDAAGLVDDLDETTYHADPVTGGSLSVSGAKVLLKAPALYQWQRTHPVERREFDFGHAAHRVVLGTGPDLVTVQRTDPKTGAVSVAHDYKTPSSREHAAAIRAAGGVPLLPKEFQVVADMAEKLTESTRAMELLSTGRAEVSAFARDEPTGVMRRGRFDWLGPNYVVDYKSSVTADPTAWPAIAARLGYHMQDAWYTDLARDLDLGVEAFAFIVQEKTAPYLVSVIELDEAAQARGRELNRRALEVYRDCAASGLWPGYQPAGAHTLVSLPRWAFYDSDLEVEA